MAFTNKLLAMGTLTVKANVLSPSGVRFLVHNITIFNTTTSLTTFKLHRNNGTEFQFYEVGIDPKKTIDFPLPAEGWVIEDGHALALEASPGAINYSIDGAEES